MRSTVSFANVTGLVRWADGVAVALSCPRPGRRRSAAPGAPEPCKLAEAAAAEVSLGPAIAQQAAWRGGGD